MNLETNDTSFESPYIGHLESAKNWAWHDPEDGHTPLTEKALLLLELFWSLSQQRFFRFQNFFQMTSNRAFF